MKLTTLPLTVLITACCAMAAHAQMSTPRPAGPPSTQAVKKEPTPTAPITPPAKTPAALGEPQIALPLVRHAKPVEAVPEKRNAAGLTRAEALSQCRTKPQRQERRECRKSVALEFKADPIKP